MRFHKYMKVIQNSSFQYSFKGYDARRLQGFMMSTNYCGIADEMQKIGKKEGFKIFSPTINRDYNKCIENPPIKSKIFLWAWAQDYWTFVKNKLICKDFDPSSYSIADYFNLNFDKTQIAIKKSAANLCEDFEDLFTEVTHIPGGNIFMVKKGRADEALVGEDELKKFSLEKIKNIYNVQKVIPLPQLDFHLDMFIRPLDKKRILLTDDRKSLKILEQISKATPKNSESAERIDIIKKSFTKAIKTTKSDIKTYIIEKTLQENGYDVIRIPGRVYSLIDGDTYNHCNFINANVLKNKRNELVYITNKSNIDDIMMLQPEVKEKLGGGFEEQFIKEIKKYINPEHLYFIDGENNFISKSMLKEFSGGIHCASSEIPLDL